MDDDPRTIGRHCARAHFQRGGIQACASFGIGQLSRRHIFADRVNFIGKETGRVSGDSMAAGRIERGLIILAGTPPPCAAFRFAACLAADPVAPRAQFPPDPRKRTE